MTVSFPRGFTRSKLLNRWGLAALIDSATPQVRGRDRALNLIRGRGVPKVLTRDVRVDWGPGLTTSVVPSLDGSFGDLFRSQWVRPTLIPILEACLDPGDVFVDVGANIGLYSSWAARLVGPTGVVIAAEPVPDTCAVLRRICNENDLSQVEVHQAAVGADAGDANMQLVPGASGLSKITAADDGINVECTTLDALLDGRTPALVKIDVEGHELEVLRGATQTLEVRPAITFESPDAINGAGSSACVDLLASHGYTTFALLGRGLAKFSDRNLSHNLLAIPSGDQRTFERLEHTPFPRNQNT